MFSVALSVETPLGVVPRVYPRRLSGLRGIAPCGVRTFLPANDGGAILHPSKTAETIDLGRLTGKGTRQVVECKTQAATGKTL